MLKKILKQIVKAGEITFGIAVVLIGIALLVNSRLFDEPPDPGIAAFVQIEASRVPGEQNAYFHMIGIGVPESEQPHAAGKSWLAAANDTQARRMKGEMAKWPGPPGVLQKIPRDLCRPEARSCLAQAREKPDEMRKLVAANESLMARYRAAQAYPAYAEPADGLLFEYPFPNFSAGTGAQQVFLMDAALRLQQGEREAVLADMGKDIAFCRRMLAGARTLIGKAVAAAYLRRSVLFASEVLGHDREPSAAALELQKLLQPLMPSERQIGDAIRLEFRGTKAGIEHFIKYPSQFLGEDYWTASWIGRAFFQPNASFNYLYGLDQAQEKADKVPASRLDAALPQRASDAAEPVIWTLFYDPVGKIAVRPNFFADFSDYIRRMHDLDALVRLIALQAEIVSKNVKDEDVPQFLAAADKRYANPWTEKPMQWDPKSRQIYFEPRSTRYLQEKIGGVTGRTSITL